MTAGVALPSLVIHQYLATSLRALLGGEPGLLLEQALGITLEIHLVCAGRFTRPAPRYRTSEKHSGSLLGQVPREQHWETHSGFHHDIPGAVRIWEIHSGRPPGWHWPITAIHRSVLATSLVHYWEVSSLLGVCSITLVGLPWCGAAFWTSTRTVPEKHQITTGPCTRAALHTPGFHQAKPSSSLGDALPPLGLAALGSPSDPPGSVLWVTSLLLGGELGLLLEKRLGSH
jgi:hypothetical protein